VSSVDLLTQGALVRKVCGVAMTVASLIVFGLLQVRSAVQAQDATAGKAAFAQCSSCHSIDGTNGTGPTLNGVFGRKAGSVADFRYSRAMKNASFEWTAQLLDAYLADPQKAVPGNVMPFSGVADAQQRADLVAYLNTLR
jgi:cytochrome c